jgi:hypothetical protein
MPNAAAAKLADRIATHPLPSPGLPRPLKLWRALEHVAASKKAKTGPGEYPETVMINRGAAPY